ncbi:MAG: hypothetical protein GX803_00760 [Lentisphaerae bacterium]|jgi:ABC-type transport system involved in multi-copper enzyme maturation permease subunit|nr:hypothetical protein [Lentisphaerota bacterium]
MPFLAIARLSALEAIRRPVFLLVALGTIVAIVLLPLLLNYTLGDSARIIRDSALALQFLGGLFLGVHAAAEGFTRELRRGTAAIILAKPVPRAGFYLARTLGILQALALYLLAALAATLLAVRVGANDFHLDWPALLITLGALLAALALAALWNHRTHRPFTSAAFYLLLIGLLLAFAAAAFLPTPLDHQTFPRNYTWNILGVGFLLYLILAMAVAFAAALATRLPPAPTLLLTAALILLGITADTLLPANPAQAPLATAAWALIPNVQAFWLIDALDDAVPIPPAYYLQATAYAATWAAAILILGALSFRRREITQ